MIDQHSGRTPDHVLAPLREPLTTHGPVGRVPCASRTPPGEVTPALEVGPAEPGHGAVVGPGPVVVHTGAVADLLAQHRWSRAPEDAHGPARRGLARRRDPRQPQP
ncbi:hypothetical protein [Kineococcus sp. SYSU DK018]|uniref:hypothetical protein n=1 Tax=Kineococcus sp. SYSU DK018 TaxID=3383139 RepID=UPI003D7DB1B4